MGARELLKKTATTIISNFRVQKRETLFGTGRRGESRPRKSGQLAARPTMFIFRQSLFSWLSILTQQQREGGVRTNNGGIDRVLCLVFVLHLFFSQKLLKIVSSDNNQTRNKYFSLRKRKCHRAPSFFYIF